MTSPIRTTESFLVQPNACGNAVAGVTPSGQRSYAVLARNVKLKKRSKIVIDGSEQSQERTPHKQHHPAVARLTVTPDDQRSPVVEGIVRNHLGPLATKTNDLFGLALKRQIARIVDASPDEGPDLFAQSFAFLDLDLDPTKGKGQTFLRLCNELLRRLSKTQNTVACGSILMTMASVFPLSERSGVNLRGEFNVENITTFEKDVQIAEADENDLLYRTVWGMQSFFSNPPLLCHEVHFNTFRKGIELVLKRFDAITSETPSSSKTKTSSSDNKRKHRSDGASAERDLEKEESFSSKFLTSRILFDFESQAPPWSVPSQLECLKDPNFRRQILIQVFIVMQFLASLSTREKEKDKEIFAELFEKHGISPNRSLQRDYTLTHVQTRQKAMRTFEDTRPDGRLFSKALNTVITHERNWAKEAGRGILWKQKSCITFEKPPLEEEDTNKVKVTSSNAIREANLGSEHLTALWSTGDTIDEKMRSRRSLLQ
ncbi:THO complex subunit 1 transcription elongation factor-domain-containing protein [Blyttiomyces helicus]|uniref:THO complex subunit 1 transcription elongation factor-domain-containing protein n=1 Tax=Blyttiomyces helicus TaxID=388810 RepID=A0A4P9WMZ0_9FUNG|nr:THO complex subunit 1 transcription elongation factor-domain-containing protein [Blyttiomyces helicus]|eukprot:RKO92116.1 THO complex subunit 1 transcription elongation factor-domain-containing protein [Blyttiomyces helicus]